MAAKCKATQPSKAVEQATTIDPDWDWGERYRCFGFEKKRIGCVLLYECAIVGAECDVDFNIEPLISNVVGVVESSTTTTLRGENMSMSPQMEVLGPVGAYVPS